jgi:hypothetical protein
MLLIPSASATLLLAGRTVASVAPQKKAHTSPLPAYARIPKTIDFSIKNHLPKSVHFCTQN